MIKINNVFSLIERNLFSNKDMFDINVSSPEDNLRLAIYKQRYSNICNYVDNYLNHLNSKERDFLKYYYFSKNTLKEINFLGTDFYINTKFIKNQVPFLYRCIGKDGQYKYEQETFEVSKHVKNIMTQARNQIETGGKGQLFSYSKCFGKMIYKYANILYDSGEIKIEVRTDAWINVIQARSKDSSIMMIQEYDSDCNNKIGEIPLPYFCIDVSSARENDRKNLEIWFDEYLGKKNSYDSLVDPIGDAEVVMNFTDLENKILASNVSRTTLNLEDFCVLLYKYFLNYVCYVNKNSNLSYFNNFISKSLDTLPQYYNRIEIDKLLMNVSETKFDDFFKLYIDWEMEEYYMTRRKDSTRMDKTPKQITIYKGENATWKVKVLKEILFEAVRYKYSHINYGGNSHDY